jgi:hypothetical protein
MNGAGASAKTAGAAERICASFNTTLDILFPFNKIQVEGYYELILALFHSKEKYLLENIFAFCLGQKIPAGGSPPYPASFWANTPKTHAPLGPRGDLARNMLPWCSAAFAPHAHGVAWAHPEKPAKTWQSASAKPPSKPWQTQAPLGI